MRVFEYKGDEEEYDMVYRMFELVNNDYLPPLFSEGSIEEYIKEVKNDGKMLYIKEENKIIAMITYWHFYPRENSAYISTISVLKEYRSKGLAKLLMNKCFNDLRSQNIKLVKLKTWSTNKITNKFYPKFGFEQIGVIKDARGRDIDTILYSKEL